MKKVDVIICTRNNEAILDRCLGSVARQTFKSFNCVVVDDCSSDNTVEIIRKKYPRVRVIKKQRQSGPSISRNIAIRKTSAEFIATVDSDAELDKNWLREQLIFMEADDSIGIAASKILYSWDKRKINSCGGGMTKLGFGFDRLSGKMHNKAKLSREPVLYGHSAAMLVRRKMLDEIGLFDETYFYGNEDTDLGWRANLAGWKVLFNPAAAAYHAENATVRKMTHSVVFHGTKNRIRSLIKNYSISNLIKYLPLHIVLIIGKTIITSHRSARLGAVFWNAGHLAPTLSERRKVQKTRKIGDNDIIKYLLSNKLPSKK